MTEAITEAVVLGVDPGTTTGLCLVEFTRAGPHLIVADQKDWSAACAVVEAMLSRMGRETRRVVAACEKFVITSQTAQRGQQGAEDALGMNGHIRRVCEITGVEYAKTASSSDAKSTVTNAALRTLGLYPVGLKHAADAARHAVLFALKAGCLDRQLLLAATR